MKVRECIFFQLASTSRNSIQFFNQNVEHLNLTGPQAMVMNLLGEKSGITFHQLGEQLNLKSPTLTGIIDRLEKIGLTERHPNPKDRRSILVSLTEKGLGVVPEIRQTVSKANQKFLNMLSHEEEVMLRGLLKRLNTN